MTRSVIFLDVDGVLNSEAWYRRRLHGPRKGYRYDEFDPRAVSVLNELVERSGAEVVVSSVWRRLGLDELRTYLRAAGYRGELHGVTPPSWGGSIRGDEIAAWLNAQERSIWHMVILDDDSDMGALRRWLVKTSWRNGLTGRYVAKALAVLARKAWRPRSYAELQGRAA